MIEVNGKQQQGEGPFKCGAQSAEWGTAGKPIGDGCDHPSYVGAVCKVRVKIRQALDLPAASSMFRVQSSKPIQLTNGKAHANLIALGGPNVGSGLRAAAL
jgi:hypothetical protein